MSTIKTAALRGLTGSADSIQLHTSDQSVTFPGNVTCSGTATGFGGGGASGTDYNDGVKTRWGTGNDLEIYHTGGDYSYIKDNSGRAHVRSDRVYIQNNAGDENMIYAEADNGVYLYHNGTAQCNTITSGLDFPTGKGIAWTANSSTGYIKANTASGHDMEFNVGGNLNQYRFKFGGTEKMRWHSNSTMCWGGTPSEGGVYDTTPGIWWHGAADGSRDVVIGTQTISAPGLALILNRSNDSTGIVAVFRKEGSSKGSISIDASSTTYSTSSDYRLKENAVAISDGITRLKTLKPYKFNFKVTPSIKVDGFFAHEVTAVPEAITGTKDAMKGETFYEEGDTLPSGKKVGDVKTYSYSEIDPQQIDQSKLVPLLTAALQEAIAKIETLETKVAALEAG